MSASLFSADLLCGSLELPHSKKVNQHLSREEELFDAIDHCETATCFLQVSNAGVEATAPGGYFKLQGSLSDAGTIEGFASVYNTSGGFPSTIRLLP